MKTSAPCTGPIRSLRYRCCHFFSCAALLAAQLTLLPGTASAKAAPPSEMDISFVQSGGDVIATYSGAVNFFDMKVGTSGSLRPSWVIPQVGGFLANVNPSLDVIYYGFVPQAFSIGPGSRTFATGAGTGDNFAIDLRSGIVFVPSGYLSNHHISGSIVFKGASLKSLGLTPGHYSTDLTKFAGLIVDVLISEPHYEQTSAQTTGLPMANAEGQMVIGATGSVTNDVNGFLFNLRAGDGEEAANDDNSGVGANLDYGVVVGQGDGPEDAKNPIAKKVLKSRQWELFTTVGYGNVKLSPIGGQSGVQVDSWAPSVGISRHLSRGLAVGFATSFLTSDQRYTGNLGNLHMEGPALSTYVSFVRKNFWNSLLYSFGDYTLDSNRNPGFGFPQAHGSTRSYTNSVQYNTGWNFRFQNNTLVTGPFAGIDYLHGTVNAYTESGGGLAALAYGKQTFQSLVTRVGWTASKKIQTDWAMVTPQVRLSYERQNLQNNGTSVNLINAPFSARGGNQSPGQSYMVAGGGVNFDFTDQLSLQLNYQVQVFRQDMQAHYGQVRIGYKF